MNNFIENYIKSTIDTIEGLTGVTPKITVKEIEDVSIISNIIPPVGKVSVLNKITNENIAFIYDPKIASMVGDLMLGGDGVSKYELNQDDLDCLKEIQSNIFGAFNFLLNEKLKDFKIKSAEYIDMEKEVDIDGFTKIIVFTIEINEITGLIFMLLEEPLSTMAFGNEKIKEDNVVPVCKNKEFNSIQNNELLDDVEVKVSVLIGSQMLTLEELKNLKENSVIELEQLANNPLTLVINNVPYAHGEVVIVDGSFGLQITKIYKKEEVYHV